MSANLPFKIYFMVAAIIAGLFMGSFGSTFLISPVPLVAQAAPLTTTPRFSSSPIAITPDGLTLLVVNPDSNSLTLVGTTSRLVLKEIAVGIDPRSVAVHPDGTIAVVANQGSNTLSIVDLETQSVTASLNVGFRPVGVACSPDGRIIAIAELGDDRVRLLDGSSLETIADLAVADRPYGLAFTPDSRTLLVTHLLSGSVTLLTVEPYTTYLPLMAMSSEAQYAQRGMPNVAHKVNIASPNLQEPVQRTIATWQKVAPAPGVVVNLAGTRAYLPQTMGNGQGLNTTFDTTVFPKVSVLNLTTQTHQIFEQISLPETDRPVGLPWDAALTKNDHELWVVNAASNDVSVINLTNPTHPTRQAHIPVSDNPRGILLSPDGGTAYVNNVLQGTVSVIDTSAYTVTQVITVTNIPMPPALLTGKRLFNSSARPDLALASWISCNTCHIEGEHDGRTWKVRYPGSVPPGKQPVVTRNTTNLLGMIETYPLRWSAEWNESADSEFSVRFEQFGSGLIQGTMNPTLGAPNQGRYYNLDCLALFIDSLALPQRTHTLSAAELRGKAVFESPQTGCQTCHPPPLYTDLKTHDVGTANGEGEWYGPSIDTPSLRFLYDSASYLHDGSAATLYDVLVTKNPADQHGVTSQLSAQDIEDLVAFLMALPYNE
jgi:YVTN family beta-propeller protein